MPSAGRESSLRARSKWAQVHAAQVSGRFDGGRFRRLSSANLPRGISGGHSFAFMLLSYSRGWTGIQTAAIILSILTFAVSTVSGYAVSYAGHLRSAEWTSSACLVLDYMLRVWTVREHRKYAGLGALEARMTWMMIPGSVLRLLACYPSLNDGTASAQSVLGMLPRLFLLFRTSWWRRALGTASRVLFVNRQILSTSLALVTLTILVSAVLLHATCSTEPRCRDETGITDFPSAAYAASMMLVGQDSPEGGKGLPAFRAAVLLTAFLSVPFFAVPAAMLTWGFEGEAARLAVREQRRASRLSYGGQAVVESSGSSSEEYEAYLESLGGDEDDEDETEAHGAKALAFFVQHAKESANESTKESGTEDAEEDSQAPSMLFRAQQLARKLERRRSASARTRALRRDALELLRKAEEDFHEGLSSDEARRVERKLRAFSKLAAEGDDDGGNVADDEGGGVDDLEAKIGEVKQEVATLRRTMIAALNDLKDAIAKEGKSPKK